MPDLEISVALGTGMELLDLLFLGREHEDSAGFITMASNSRVINWLFGVSIHNRCCDPVVYGVGYEKVVGLSELCFCEILVLN